MLVCKKNRSTRSIPIQAKRLTFSSGPSVVVFTARFLRHQAELPGDQTIRKTFRRIVQNEIQERTGRHDITCLLRRRGQSMQSIGRIGHSLAEPSCRTAAEGTPCSRAGGAPGRPRRPPASSYASESRDDPRRRSACHSARAAKLSRSSRVAVSRSRLARRISSP